MITLKKRDSAPIFGEINRLNNSFILLTQTGTKVKNSLASLRFICEDIRLWQYIMMPDHVHFLINVEDRLEEPLGNYLARLKVLINKECSELIFEQGFNDQIITPSRSLDAVFQYIKDNPRRLSVRFEHPEYFRRINEIQICGRMCKAYGNLQLLANPFKEQVVCHRADTDTVKKSNSDKWIYTAANGGVLVSPFISPVEKDIRKKIEELEGKVILISNRPFGDREKPAAHDFEQCERGNLLILFPLGLSENLDRSTCLAMNEMAASLAGSSQAGRH